MYITLTDAGRSAPIFALRFNESGIHRGRKSPNTRHEAPKNKNKQPPVKQNSRSAGLPLALLTVDVGRNVSFITVKKWSHREQSRPRLVVAVDDRPRGKGKLIEIIPVNLSAIIHTFSRFLSLFSTTSGMTTTTTGPNDDVFENERRNCSGPPPSSGGDRFGHGGPYFMITGPRVENRSV